jgi:general secretion pathway protein L
MQPATTNWRQRVRDAANRAGLPRFWRWWIGELAPLLPAPSRALIQRRFARPVIEFADGEAVFWRPEFTNGAARLAIAEKVALTGDPAAVLAAGRAAVARLAAHVSGGIAAPRVIVALNAQRVLRKELVLPAAVEENLAQALAYDLDRHTPFRPEQLYFDVAVIGRDAARKALRVDWVAALKTVVDGAVKQIEEWGAVPLAVVPGLPAAIPTRLNLLPHAARPRPLQWRRWQMWAPLAVVAIFALAAVIVPLAQKREYAIALNLQNTAAGQQAQAADKLRAQLEAMQNDYNYILAKKYAFPSAVRVLDEVTRVLPDDTWITQFELKTSSRGKETQRDLYLRGESANAGKLIALLEDSRLVEQAAPRSPTTKIQGSTGEIFDLSARLRALAPPTAQPLAAGATPTSAAPVAAAAPAPVAAPVAAAPAPVAAAPAAAAPEASESESAPAPDAEAERSARRARRAAMSPQAAPAFGPLPNAPFLPPSAMPPGTPAPRITPRPAAPATVPLPATVTPPATVPPPAKAPQAAAPPVPPTPANPDAPPPAPAPPNPGEDN